MSGRFPVVIIGISFVLLAASCSKGPPDKQAISDIEKRISNGALKCMGMENRRVINKAEIVGRVKKDDMVVVQAIVNYTASGPCKSLGGKGAGTFNCKTKTYYEQFGDSWTIAEFVISSCN